MNEQKEAQQFSREIDSLLNGKTVAQDPGFANATELDVAQTLATADFSVESQVRQTLKQKLLNPATGEKEIQMNTPIFQRSYVRVALAALLIAFVLLAISPVGATLAQNVIQTVKSWQIGEHTTAVSVEGDFEAVQAEDGSTVVQAAPQSPEIIENTASELEGENGRRIVLEPTLSLEAAQERLNFTLRQPTFVPDGYVFQGVVRMNANQASVEYINEAEVGLIGLLQTAVGSGNDGVQVTFSSDIITENVQVNGVDALWTSSGDEGLLIWEVDDVNYQLAGIGNLDLALQIAESIQ